MADYYPLLARALVNLKSDDPAARTAVFGRARAALAQQLRSIDPPLSEADIARERLSLDEAINRLEAEHAARHAVLDLSSPEPEPAGANPAGPTPVAQPGSALPELSSFGSASSGPVSPQEARSSAETDDGSSTPQRPILPIRGASPGAAQPVGAMVDVEEPEDVPSSAPLARDNSDPGQRERPRIEPARPSDPARRRRMLVLAIGLAVPIGIIATLAIVFKDKPATIPAPQENGVAVTAQSEQKAGEQKFAERIGGRPADAGRSTTANQAPGPSTTAPQPSNGAPATGSAAPAQGNAPPVPARQEVIVAQKAAIYEETGDPNQQALILPARVAWRVDSVNVAQGQPAQTAIRADVESPEAGLAMTMLIRRNNDPTLPAAHLIQLTFAPMAGTAPRQIRDVGLPAFKPDEASRGVQLAGLPVPVGENLFLIGLSNLPVEVSRNLELMATRPWIDIPYRLANGRRGFIALDKGVPGDAAFQEAMRAWQEGR
jgi:hypothetical protein